MWSLMEAARLMERNNNQSSRGNRTSVFEGSWRQRAYLSSDRLSLCLAGWLAVLSESSRGDPRMVQNRWIPCCNLLAGGHWHLAD